MNPDIFLKVIGYAIIPLVMAWMGNHLTSKVYDHEPKTRRIYRAAFCLLVILGVGGTWIVEWRSDLGHKAELKAQHDDVNHLTATLQESQIQNAAGMAYLKAKLEDAIKQGPPVDLNRLGKEIVAANAALIEKQTIKLTNKQLADAAHVLATKMLQFEENYKHDENDLRNKKRYTSPGSVPNYAEFLSGEQQREDRLREQYELNLKSQFLPQAEYLQEAILARLKASNAEIHTDLTEQTIRHGWIVGPNPASEIAAYLERIANRLADQ